MQSTATTTTTVTTVPSSNETLDTTSTTSSSAVDTTLATYAKSVSNLTRINTALLGGTLIDIPPPPTSSSSTTASEPIELSDDDEEESPESTIYVQLLDKKRKHKAAPSPTRSSKKHKHAPKVPAPGIDGGTATKAVQYASLDPLHDQMMTYQFTLERDSTSITTASKTLLRQFSQEYNALQQKQKELNIREAAWNAHIITLSTLASLKDVVKLNFRGTIFMVNRQTLLSDPDTLLYAMFCGRWSEQLQADGSYFIDRSPSGFDTVIRFLAGEFFSITNTSRDIIRYHADFFNIAKLLKQLDANDDGIDTKSSLKESDAHIGCLGCKFASTHAFKFADRLLCEHKYDTAVKLVECNLALDSEPDTDTSSDDDENKQLGSTRRNIIDLKNRVIFKSDNRFIMLKNITNKRSISTGIPTTKPIKNGDRIVFKFHQNPPICGFIIFPFDHTANASWPDLKNILRNTRNNVHVSLIDCGSMRTVPWNKASNINSTRSLHSTFLKYRPTDYQLHTHRCDLVIMTRSLDGSKMLIQQGYNVRSFNVNPEDHIHPLVWLEGCRDSVEIV